MIKASESLSPQERTMKRLGERAEATSVVYVSWNCTPIEVSVDGPPSNFGAPDRFWHPVMLNEASPERIKQVWLNDPYDGMAAPPVSPEQVQALYKDLPKRSPDYLLVCLNITLLSPSLARA